MGLGLKGGLSDSAFAGVAARQGMRRVAAGAARLLSPFGQRVPQKLGLRQEVNKRAERWVDGIGWDGTLGWGVLSEEWDTAAQRLRPPAS